MRVIKLVMKPACLFAAQVFLFASISAPAAQAQGNDPTDGWYKRTIDDSLDGAIGVCVHDIDADGNPDVVATGEIANATVWYEAPDIPTGSWTKHDIDTSLDGAIGVCVHDIDADGNPDVVAAGNVADNVVWYEASDDPTGSWTKHTIDANLDYAVGVYVYDIDADGNPDVAATGLNDDETVWYEAPDDPTGSWTKHTIDVSLDGATGVYIHDIDDDGNPDVVATGFFANVTVWYEAPDDPTGSWTKHDIDTSLSGAFGVYVSDIDTDGNPDVVATGETDNDVVWYEAPDDPTGSWTKHDIDASLGSARGVYVHDINDDGNPDVVAAGFTDNDVVWYEAPDDPTGSWTKHDIDASLDGAAWVDIHDIDADGNPDVVATGLSDGDVVWYRLEWQSYKTGCFPVGDKCDTFSDYGTEHTVYMYGACFKRADNLTGSWPKHDIDTNLDGAIGVCVHDIDADGNPDVVVAGNVADNVVWYEAPDIPTGSWTKHDIDTSLDDAIGVCVHDIDTDGNPDVVATGASANVTAWYQAPSDPTGSWTKHTIDASLEGARGVYVHDIDTDGNPDVVAAGTIADNVVWYEAPDDPTGSWTKRTIDASLDAALGVYVHDIDADGNPDVVATGFSANVTAWYEAPDDPTGSWTKYDIDTSLSGAFGVYVHDIDTDGNPDVVATGFSANVAAWYQAPDDPTGSWTKRTIDVGLVDARGVYVHDIDTDGNPDVVAAGYNAEDVVWYEALDDPTGSWTKHTIDTSLVDAFVVYVHDIDADGNPDVVATGMYDGDVVWYEFPQIGGKSYKVVFWEGTTTERQTEIVTAQDATISAQHTFLAGTDNPGTWYAGVYPTSYDPTSYNATDTNLIWGDTFEVQASAIPEFPTVIAAIVALGLCIGIYFRMRRKAVPSL